METGDPETPADAVKILASAMKRSLSVVFRELNAVPVDQKSLTKTIDAAAGLTLLTLGLVSVARSVDPGLSEALTEPFRAGGGVVPLELDRAVDIAAAVVAASKARRYSELILRQHEPEGGAGVH